MRESSLPLHPRCLRLHEHDNVAVALDDVAPGPISIVGSHNGATVEASESAARGHKIALESIDVGAKVRKHGVPIGFATQPIAAGAWVHTHNCRSGLDERSHTLDRNTGAPTDTRYV
jgi:altronate hydrolase